MLTFEVDAAGIGSLTLCRPPANAFNDEVLDEFDRLISRLQDLHELKILIVRSQTGIFSAGADIGMIEAMLRRPDGPRFLAEFAAKFQSLLKKFRILPFCTIAAIAGAATGGGFELALSCDLRVIGSKVRCGLPEIKLGLVPAAGGTQMVAELAGKPAAFRLILTGDLVCGQEAGDLGLAQFVTADDEVESFAADLARRVAASPKMAIAANKRCVSLAGTEHGFISEIIGTSALHQQAETHTLVSNFLHARRSRRAS